ncbi:hypothetical protein OPV22_017721 [Ensete ventricosum]|uniref:Uncharacterized protein n=1 Tax=Ensete ventricosum TaxID=4639 RepID=A0AAV8QTU3_ENSVE|nr:hypothetical protein OPV22_017721 [Ensete ventricosum]
MEGLRRHEESCQQRITKAKEDLLAFEKELTDHPIYEAPTDEIERVGNQILELLINAIEVKSQRKEKENILLQKKLILKQYIDRLKEMENNNNKLLQALRNSGSNKIFEAYKWVQEHRSELRKEVYGPVLLEVKVPDLLHASYLERHVPNYIWKVEASIECSFKFHMRLNDATSVAVDVGDLEKLKFMKVELEQVIGELEGSLKMLHAQQRQLEDEEANLHKQQNQIIQTYKLAKKKRCDLERFVVKSRCKLDSLNKEDDLELGTKKFIDQAAKLNEKRPNGN